VRRDHVHVPPKGFDDAPLRRLDRLLGAALRRAKVVRLEGGGAERLGAPPPPRMGLGRVSRNWLSTLGAPTSNSSHSSSSCGQQTSQNFVASSRHTAAVRLTLESEACREQGSVPR